MFELTQIVEERIDPANRFAVMQAISDLQLAGVFRFITTLAQANVLAHARVENNESLLQMAIQRMKAAESLETEIEELLERKSANE